MMEPTNTTILKDPAREAESMADVTSRHGPDMEYVGEQGMSASTTQTSITAWAKPRKARKRISDRIAEPSITVHGARTDGKGTSQPSSISISPAASINLEEDPMKYRRSMSAVYRMQETLRQKQIKYKEERESRRANIDSLYEYVFGILAHRLDLEYTTVVELVLDAPSFQDFDDFFSVGGRRSLIFFYQEAEVPGIECGRIVPGAIKKGKMMRLFLGSIDDIFKGLCLVFIRCNNHIVITKKNVHEELHFSVLDATEGLFTGISDLLSKAFLPVIKATDNWGHLYQAKHMEGEKQQFVEAIDQYLSHLLGVKLTIEEGVKLNNIESINFAAMQSFEGIRAAASDEAVVARCEEALVVWYSQIHQVLLENEQVRREADDSGPMTELEHWIRNYMKFNFIIEQVKGENVKAVVVVLTMAKSKLIKMWKELDLRITNAANESKDNVSILDVLEQACQPLYTLDMASMVRGVPKLLNAIQTIYVVSTYYQTSEHITSLFMKVTNQIVTACKAYITDKGKLNIWDQDVETVMLKIKECTFLIQEYQECFYRKQTYCEMQNEKPFDVSEIYIFGKLKAFCERTDKITEILSIVQTYSALSKSKIEGMDCLDLKFKHIYQNFKKRTFNILNMKKTEFDADLTEFLGQIIDFEEQIQDFMSNSIGRIRSPQEAAQLLQRFQNLNVPCLKSEIPQIIKCILQHYMEMLQATITVYECYKEDPPIFKSMPPVSGRILWSRHLFSRMHVPITYLKNNSDILSGPEGEAAVRLYNSIACVLVKYEVLLHRIWCNDVPSELQDALQANLLVHHSETKQMMVNFDNKILQILQETKYIMKIGLDVPEEAEDFLKIDAKLKSNHLQLEKLLKTHETICGQILPAFTKVLSGKMNKVESTFFKGLSKLTWSSFALERYFEDLDTNIHIVSHLINQVNDIQRISIDAALKDIAETLLITLPEDGPTRIENIITSNEIYTKKMAKYLNHRSEQIEQAVEKIVQIFKTVREPKSATSLKTRSKKKETRRVAFTDTDKYEEALEEQTKDEEFNKQCHEVYSYFTGRLVDSLQQCTCFSLDYLKRKLFVSSAFDYRDFLSLPVRRDDPAPFLIAQVHLVMDNIVMLPSLDNIQQAMHHLVETTLGVSRGVYQWEKWKVPEVASVQEFSGSADIVSGQQKKAEEEMKEEERPKRNFYSSVIQGTTIPKLDVLVSTSVNSLREKVSDALRGFEKYRTLWTENREIKVKEYVTENQSLDEIKERISYYYMLEQDVSEIDSALRVGFIELNTAPIKKSISAEAKAWKLLLCRSLNEEYKMKMVEMSEFITEYMKILSRPILDLDDVRCVMEALTIIRENEIRMDSSVGPAEEAYAILSRFQFDFTREEYEVIDTLRYSFSKLISKAASVQHELIRIQPELKRKLLESVEILQNDMVAFDSDYEKDGPLVPGITCKEANARLQIFQMRFDDLWRKCVTCSSGEQLFGLPVSDWDILHKRRKELELLQKLYALYDILINTISGYYETLWIEFNIKKLYAELQDFQKKCDNLPEGLKHWQAFQDLKKTIDDFSDSCPLLEMMLNDAMKKRHWDHIANLVGRRLNVQSDSFCLGDIMEASILQHKYEIEDICVSAVKEKEIESKLAQVSDVWNKQVLKFSNLKGRGEVLIEGAEAAEIIVTIEDSLMVLGSLLNNRYNEHFKKTIQGWIQQLSASSAMLEEWLQVQTLWIYLEAVFVSGDIASQLPEEAKRFKNIDKTWMKLMQQAHDRARVSQCCVGDEALIHILPYLHEQLQICQKSLSGCLEQKRSIFPRFFFVSDTVLLEILGQASDSHNILPHLAALSANINEVEFSATHYDRILSVVSREGEVIKLDRPVQARGPIELWLGELLLMQQNSLHGVIRSAYGQITDGGCQLVNFFNNFPTQVGLLALQMLWTHDSEEALCTMKEHGKVLQSTRQKFNEILIELIGQIVRDLNEHDRMKYETLITIHINQRDVFDDLVKMHIRSANDFEWLKQSRVYFKEWLDKVLVSITDVDFVYQNEFLGCTERLVITQLTDRCYISLAQAIGMNMGGAPTGPAATGKTETVKDMGKALGKYVMVFNCSDQMDFRGLGRIFKGLAQSGSWGCLDELNLIELPVLSVTAQQIYIVLSAQKGRREQFHFSDGVIVNLNPEFGIFLTVNPVYTGRQELPENLKIQFRTVSMMVPDRKTIIRIKLASSGFVDFLSLSQKFYALYKLCEEQLSRQVHYDFGLRNILSVLRTVRALKRERPDESESSIVTRGLRDMNVSKLVADDEPLFQSLIDDLFPGIQIDTNSYTELQNAVSNQVRLSGLVNHPPWNLKLIQLYETAQVRHGLMTLGPSGSGKTSLIHLLMKALTACGLPHREVRMNPKAITVPQMFGRLDTASNDWTDGIFSTLWRKMLKSKKGENFWIVLDGPVDSIWIENLSSVLDDNKTLTLANGDRIPMAPCCKLLFEVDSLENASPSAVSRMGMVFLSSSVLSWRIIIKAWLNKRSAEEREIFQTLYDKVFEDGYTYVHRNLHPKMQLLECNYITQSISLLEGCIPTKDECAAPDLGHLHRLFVFALMWSLGALLELDSRDRLEAFLKNHESKLDLPEGDAGARQPMFEFLVNENGEWEHWSKRVSQYSYPMDYVPDYKSILVPNIDSVRTQFLIDTIAKQQKAVLLIGETGAGKTVVIKSYMSRYNTEEHVSKSLNFSSATEPGMFQRAIESFVDKRIGSTYGPLGGRKMTVFIDDINMPAVNDCGDQVTNEIVRQMMEMKGMYSLVKPGDFMTIADVQIIGAMIHPGGRNDIPQRLKRQFTIFNCTSPSNASIDQIFGAIGCGYYHSCRNFEADVCDLVKKLVPASRALWQMTKVKMLPTPSKSHYIFNLRDLSRIWQGMISITAEKCDTVSRLLALFKHECQRVIADRFVTSEDHDWFDESLAQVIAEHVDAQSVSEVKNDFYFVDFLREDPEPAGEEPEELVLKSPKLYQMVLSFDVLSEQLKLYQTQLNDVQGSTMDLVFFKDAVIHLIKISRIIRTDYGNALLVGVGGSGKRSLSRLASFIAGYKVFQIVLTRSYGVSNLLEDLKLLYKTAGAEGKGITFIFTDHDIKEETFLEYIGYILSSGEVSGLFSREELEEITQSLLPVMKVEFPRQPPTFDNLYEYFISRCRKNLHIILCFSPVGDKFRTWSQKFPALLSGCTMDWFSLWPREALVAISSHFLSGLDFSFSSEVKSHVMEAMGVFHEKMSESCQSFFHRFRGRVYITQKSYLSFIHSYKSVYREKLNNINEQTERMNRGLSKLIEANESIRNLSKELEAKEKDLALASVKAEKVLEELTVTVQEAAKIKIKVQLVKEKVQRLVEKIENENHTVEKILEAVRPTLEDSEAALNRIKPTDISAVRKRAKPPHLTMRIMDSLLLFLQKKLDPVVIDPEKRCCKPSWGEALKLMSKSEFLLSLKKFQKDSINEEMVELLQPYFQMEDYTMENAGKVCGNFAGLLSWTLAMAKFYEVNKEVLPLKANLIKQDHHLQATNCELSAVQLHLDEKEAELNKAQAKYDGAMLEKMNLLSQVEIFRKKIEAASALIEGLSEEKIRWTEQSEVFKTHLNRLAGDVLLASAFLSYCGPFNETFRNLLLKDIWLKEIRSRNIPWSENLSAVSVLADQLTVSEWILQGLPGDDLSIQNGIIITKAARYPLLIDPQSQGKTWIKNKEKDNGLQVTSLNHKCFHTHLEACLSVGRPLLIEDIGEELDPSLDNVLEKHYVKSGSSLKVKVGDKEFDVVDKFRLYITTELPNPVFTPEINAKTLLIDFTVTIKGLENQLLDRVLFSEKPELEAERIKLMKQVNVNKRKIQELEDSLLYRLSVTTGYLVEDKSLMEILRITKQRVGELKGKLHVAANKEAKIMEAREEYRPAAARGSLLYTLMTEMNEVHVMYNVSLRQFFKLFDRSTARSVRSPHSLKRIRNITEYLTYEVFSYYCRGLYERHKFLFVLLLTLRVDLQRGYVKHKEFRALLQGGAALDLKACPPKPYKWILDMTWRNLVELSKLSQFSEIMTQVTRNEKAWKNWMERDFPEEEIIPDGYNNSLNSFHRLLLIRSCCPDRTLPQARKYIRDSLNAKYIEPNVLNLTSTWEESDPRTPLLCLLSRGYDPTNHIDALARKLKLECRAVSMGQGQGVLARRLLQMSMQQGGWILLQNCHLDLDFMVELLETIESSAAVHETFRVWMTTEPHEQFPITLLQASIRFTHEPPQGLRAGLKRTFSVISQDVLDASSSPMWKPLLYTVAFLHSAVQERRKYGPLGWNIPYGFNSADFTASVQFIQNHLDECGIRKSLSWSAVRYMIGEVQYGGRITQHYDKLLLNCFAKVWFSEKIFDPTFCFYTGYKIPQCKTVEQYIDYIQSLPAVNSPQVLGLHPNADITYKSKAAADILNTITNIQPKESHEDMGDTLEAVVYGIAEDMLERLPLDYISHEVRTQLQRTGALNPMNTFLRQEIDRMQKVISIVRSDLSDLKLAIDGKIIMNETFRDLLDAMYDARIPRVWSKVSWTSSTLGLWFSELLERSRQLTSWIYEGRPNVFWMTGFFNPQGFLTAIIQEAVQAHKGWALESMTVKNVILKQMKEEIAAPPSDGVYIHGLFLEGAGWDRRNSKLVECTPRVLFAVLPVVHIFADNLPPVTDPSVYTCPVYKKPERTDPNYVTSISMKTSLPPDYWILRGVAALCDIK